MTDQTTKRRGRPVGVRSAEAEMLPKTDKKGTPSRWKPAGKLGGLQTPEGYQGRWCSRDPINIEKKLAEGWTFVNKTTAPKAKQVGADAPDAAYDGTALDSAVGFRDMVGMMLPIEDLNGNGLCVVEREKYIAELSEHQLRSRVNLGKEKNGDSDSKRFASKFKPSLTIE